MKIKNINKINERIAEYMEREKLNNFLGATIALPISEDEIRFENQIYLKKFANEFRNDMKKQHAYYSENEAIVAAILLTFLKEEFPGVITQMPPIVLHEIFKNTHYFRKGEIEENAYFKNINFDEFENKESGDFKFKKIFIHKNKLFHYNIPKSCFDGINIPRIGAFDHGFHYPCIKEKDKVWMSITPSEIYTMEKPIAKAHGNVLTIGCGLGYYAYMVSEKENVKSVTIVEKSSDVIHLFETYLLPQFKNKDKIKIIKADGYEYLEQLEDKQYDYCFIDIWKGNTDYIPYLKSKKICRKFKSMKTHYWVEDSIVTALMGYVYIIILEDVYKNNNIQVPELPDHGEKEEYTLNYFRKILENKEINTVKDVDFFMDYKNIVKLL